MTKSEYYKLDPTECYFFFFYWGERKYGYIAEQDNLYYIITPSQENRDRKASEVGFPVVLDTIETWQKVDKHKLHTGSNNYETPLNDIYEVDTMIILGAGASFDYSFRNELSIEEKPPLGKDLFSDRYADIIQGFPGAISLASEILRSKNIEDYFQKQWNKITISHNKLLLNKLIDVQFYLRNLFLSISNKCNEKRKNNYNILVQQLYNQLVEKGTNQRCLLVTFNYDTLLEQSLSQTLNYEFNSIKDYVNIERNNMLLFKPHGSWNWAKKISDDFFAEKIKNTPTISETTNTLFYKEGYSLNKIYQIINSEIEVINTNKPNWMNMYFPSLLLPYSKKDDFVMPESHKRLLEMFLPRIRRIITIGWKGTEYAFQKILQKHLSGKKTEILSVNLKDSSFEREMKDYLPNAQFSSFAPYSDSKGTFSEFTEFVLEFGKI